MIHNRRQHDNLRVAGSSSSSSMSFEKGSHVSNAWAKRVAGPYVITNPARQLPSDPGECVSFVDKHDAGVIILVSNGSSNRLVDCSHT